MRAIAINTVHGKRVIRARDPKVPHDRGEIEDVVIPPNREFDTKDFGMNDKEAAELFRSGAAKRKTRQVADDGQSVAAVPRPPASGATSAPDPDRVADRAMAGENLFGGQQPPENEPEPDFEQMSVAELKDYAEVHGVDLTGRRTKAEIIEALTG